MDPAQVAENNHDEEQNQLAVAPFAAASLSLSLSNVLSAPTQFFQQRKNADLLAAQATKMKIPTQVFVPIGIRANLSSAVLILLRFPSSAVTPAAPDSDHRPSPLISTAPSATVCSFTASGSLSLWVRTTKFSFKSTISANPLQSPFTLGPHRPLDPSNAAGIRRASIVWFRNDLRVHDNECLNSANNESMSVLPVYCFDPREYGKSSSGFNKTGTFQASFALETVADLRKNLQTRGSDLVIRVGRPEEVLVEMAKAIGADAIYAHREVSKDEAKAEQKVEAAMKDEGVEMKYFWGSTLFHSDDLPFKVQDTPTNYSSFKEKVRSLEVRKTIAALDQLKGVPKRGDVELGKMPSLADLGVNASMPQDGKAASMFGGETEALERIKKFASECQKQPNNGNNENIYGANFSTKIAPWLTNGSISPRAVFDELKKTASNAISAAKKSDDGGSSWLMNELMWRDFFRFVTKKYSTPAPTTVGAPAMA